MPDRWWIRGPDWIVLVSYKSSKRSSARANNGLMNNKGVGLDISPCPSLDRAAQIYAKWRVKGRDWIALTVAS